MPKATKPKINMTSTAKSKPTSKKHPAPKFPYNLPYPSLNLRTNPEFYRIGLGEQGVLSVEPYKSELLPHWRFRTPSIARESSTTLLTKFHSYLDADDFVGADMTRKFVQMGVTRSRRYANHKGGRKYEVSKDGKEKVELPRDEEDGEKAECARVFGEVLKVIKEDGRYKELEKWHRELYDSVQIPRMEGDGVDVKVKQIEEGPRKVTLAMARKRVKVGKVEVERKEVDGEEEEKTLASTKHRRVKKEMKIEEEDNEHEEEFKTNKRRKVKTEINEEDDE